MMRLVYKFEQFRYFILLTIMVVSIQQVLRPLLITSFIMGLGTYPKKQSSLENRWIAHLSILYSLTIWFFYAYLLYYALSSFKCEMVDIGISFISVLTINIFTAVISVIMNFYYQKKFEISLKKLSTVDDTLKELGVPKTYQKIHTCSKLVIIGWIVYSLIKIFGDALWIRKSNEIYFWNFILSYTYNHSILINLFAELLFIFILWYVGTRFDKINECMRCLLVREGHGLRCTWKKSVVTLHRYTLCTDYKQTLWTSMHLHLELCRIVRKLNFIFGTRIIFGLAMHFIYITTICYHFYMMLIQKYPKELLHRPIVWFSIISCIFVLLIRAYAINYICQSVMDKANEIDKIIHQLTNTLRYADMYQEVFQFTLQLMHCPLKLTGLNLFYLGNECLQKLCITVVTYLIIMVQMEIIFPLNENYV